MVSLSHSRRGVAVRTSPRVMRGFNMSIFSSVCLWVACDLRQPLGRTRRPTSRYSGANIVPSGRKNLDIMCWYGRVGRAGRVGRLGKGSEVCNTQEERKMTTVDLWAELYVWRSSKAGGTCGVCGAKRNMTPRNQENGDTCGRRKTSNPGGRQTRLSEDRRATANARNPP